MHQKCVHFAEKLVENTTTFLAGVHFYQTEIANTSLKLVIVMYISVTDTSTTHGGSDKHGTSRATV